MIYLLLKRLNVNQNKPLIKHFTGQHGRTDFTFALKDRILSMCSTLFQFSVLWF